MAGNFSEGERLWKQALATFRKMEFVIPEINTLNKLGFASYVQGNLSDAITYFRASTTQAQLQRYRHAIVDSLPGFAGVALSQGSLQHSALLLGAAEAIGEIISGTDPDQHIIIQRTIASLHEQLAPEMLVARSAEGRALDWEQAVELALQAV